MTSGPPKQFDPDRTLDDAQDVFWRDGYAAASIGVLEAELGVGRKSLYDTYGGKKALYVKALERYAASVIQAMCDGLDRESSPAAKNLERVLGKLARHHGSADSKGCLLGVAMAQGEPGGEGGDAGAVVRDALARLEDSFAAAVERGQAEGGVQPDLSPRDQGRALVALTQGIALMGRASVPPATLKGAVRAALAALLV